MDKTYPIDARIRAFLKTYVENHAELSVAVGHSTSWLHKYVNGQGHATIDDLVRIGGMLIGVNLPVLSETEQKLLKACRGLEEPDFQDVIAYADLRRRRAQRGGSKESSEKESRMPPATVRKARGTR